MVDASIALKWFLDEDGSDTARLLLDDNSGLIFAAPNELLAPAILPIEVRYVLGKQFNKGVISFDMLVGSLGILRKIFGSFAPIDYDLIEQASTLSFRTFDANTIQPTFGIYDCLYISLAMACDAELVTSDRRQADLAQHHGVSTRVI